MRVLVTGSSGQLARAIMQIWTGVELIMPPESLLDLAAQESIQSIMEQAQPDVVINTGAFTQVDLCESQVEKAMLVNGTAVGWLAESCLRHNSRLVQISTDYVFDGRSDRPYREEDPVAPVSVYGKSKLLGEQEARRDPRHLIVRTAWLYDIEGTNFYNTMLHLAQQGSPIKVVDDQRGSPTSCRALARQLQALVGTGWSGTIHATCAGETTWFGFAAEIFRQQGSTPGLSPCATEDFPRPAPRPRYSVLSGDRRRLLGVDLMPDWRDALAEIAQGTIPENQGAGNG